MGSSDSGGYRSSRGLGSTPLDLETASLWPFGTNFDPCFQFIPPLSIFVASKEDVMSAAIRVPKWTVDYIICTTPLLFWLVVWNIFYFPIYWEFPHAN